MRCIVFGCKSNYSKVRQQIIKNVSFFRTPENEELKNKWLEVLKNQNIFIGKQKKICSDHFQPYDSFVATSGINKGRRLLNRDAVPSLNLPKCDVSDLEYQKFNKALFPSKKLVEYHRSKSPLLKRKKKKFCRNCERRKKRARATHKTKDPNIDVVTIKEESNESIKEESDVSCTYEISILDENHLNTTINDAYSNSSIHIEPPKENQFRICDTTNLSSCVCSNRIIQVQNRQDLLEKKLDELLDLVRDISRRIRT